MQPILSTFQNSSGTQKLTFQERILQRIKDSVDASKRTIEYNSDGIHIHSPVVYISIDNDTVWCFHIKENRPKRIELEEALSILSNRKSS